MALGDITKQKTELPARPMPLVRPTVPAQSMPLVRPAPAARRTQSAFTLEVAALSAMSALPGAGRGVYGRTPIAWCPFPGQERPLADYATELIEHFDFDPQVSEVTLVDDPGARRPGIIVIDPAFITQDVERARLRKAVTRLPAWVLPLLVVPADDARTNELAARTRAILKETDACPTPWARTGTLGVRSLDAFISLVPRLVAQAEREYMRWAASAF